MSLKMAQLFRPPKKENWLGPFRRFNFIKYYTEKWEKMVKGSKVIKRIKNRAYGKK
jgi:hypothetical protein